MDAILMMFSRDLKRLTFENIIPFNMDDLLMIASPCLAFRLTDIVDDNNNYFCIKNIVTASENKTVFATDDFNKRCGDFAKIFDARIERFFVTKKVDYLFFDQEEQIFLRGIIHRNTLSCSVSIYIRDDIYSDFKEVEFTDLSPREFLDVSKFLRRMRVAAVMKPERYYSMHSLTKKNTERKSSKIKRGGEEGQLEGMFKKYPKLKLIRTKTQFRTYYRGLSKKYHPDNATGSHEIFSEINKDFDILMTSYWYRSLKDDMQEQDDEEKKQNAGVERNILTSVKEERSPRDD